MRKSRTILTLVVVLVVLPLCSGWSLNSTIRKMEGSKWNLASWGSESGEWVTYESTVEFKNGDWIYNGRVYAEYSSEGGNEITVQVRNESSKILALVSGRFYGVRSWHPLTWGYA